jgi:predicted acetyltransferase
MRESRAEARSIEVREAAPLQEALMQNLMQLYTHDFSEFWAGSERGDLNSLGRFETYPLEGYWSRPGWHAGLIWCDSQLAGFALINDETHSMLPADRNMAEFFVVRKYRGSGVGRAAAEILLSRHPGSWEIAVARKNVRALKFWRDLVRDSPRLSGFEEMDVRSPHWNGPILRFDWRKK